MPQQSKSASTATATPSPEKLERVTSTIILGESLADVPLGKYVVVRVWVGDKPDENGSDVQQVFALKSVRFRRYSKMFYETQREVSWKRPGNHDEAIRDGWHPAYDGEHSVIVPITFGDSDDPNTATYAELGEYGSPANYGTISELSDASNMAARLVPTVVYEAHKAAILKELGERAVDIQRHSARTTK